MGGLISGIYDLAAGDPTKHEQNQLGELAGYDTTAGEGLTTAGATFDEGILSGDPSKIDQTLAPEISSGQQQVQQAADQTAQFGNRSGGSTAITADAAGKERGNIINLVGGLQSGTASSALSAGGNLLNQASSNTLSEADLAAQNQKRVGGDVGGIAQSVAEIATGFAGGGAVPGAGGDGSFGGLTPESTGGYADISDFAPTGSFDAAGNYA